jgi:hypothetical protein
MMISNTKLIRLQSDLKDHVKGEYEFRNTRNGTRNITKNIEAMKAAATMELTAIPKEAFIRCFQDLQKHWVQCIDCSGDYFEGERNHLFIS